MNARPHGRARPPRHQVRIYLKQGEVVGYGVAAAGQHSRVQLVGFTPAHSTPGNVLHLAGELLRRTHLAASVELSLRDTDPQTLNALTYLLRCVGVETTRIEDSE